MRPAGNVIIKAQDPAGLSGPRVTAGIGGQQSLDEVEMGREGQRWELGSLGLSPLTGGFRVTLGKSLGQFS